MLASFSLLLLVLYEALLTDINCVALQNSSEERNTLGNSIEVLGVLVVAAAADSRRA